MHRCDRDDLFIFICCFSVSSRSAQPLQELATSGEGTTHRSRFREPSLKLFQTWGLSSQRLRLTHSFIHKQMERGRLSKRF